MSFISFVELVLRADENGIQWNGASKFFQVIDEIDWSKNWETDGSVGYSGNERSDGIVTCSGKVQRALQNTMDDVRFTVGRC